MEFKIRKEEFLRGLYLAHGIADRKSTLPILANVLLRTEGKDKLLCGATDMNVTTTRGSEREDREGGRPDRGGPSALRDREGVAGGRGAFVRTEQNWAEIRSGKVEFKVVGMSDRDYPKLPAIQEAEVSKVDSAVLRGDDRPRRSSPCPGRNAPAPGRRSVRVGWDHGPHGVDRWPSPLQGVQASPWWAEAGPGVLIPRKGVVELRRAIETREAPCAIGVHDGNFVLKADDVGISVKLIEGQFPPYEQVIPKDNERVGHRSPAWACSML